MVIIITLDEIKRFVDKDRVSTKKHKARVGLRYYEAEHDIKDYRMFYYDSDGMLQEDVYRTNVSISHPFFTELVNQCTDYILSSKESIVKSDFPDLQNALDEYFNDEFKKELKDLVSYSQIEGFSYLYRYKDEELKSRFKFADGLGVIEVDKKFTSDGNNYVIYYYKDTILNEDFTEINIDRVQVWDSANTYYYIIKDEQILIDEDEPLNPRPHIIYKEGDKLYFDVFDDIPFYRLDNNKKQESELKPIKALIDDYDIHACSLTNDIQDFNSAIYLVKGYQGNDLNKLMTNLKTKKIIGVGEAGGLEVKTVDIPYEARQIKLELDEKNIYKFGFGFNSSQLGDGNVTNVVIKSRYALLDLKCNRIESNLRSLMKDLIQIALDEINTELKTGYTLKDVYMDFERTIITNELDNAEIKLKESSRQQTAINTLLSVTNYLGDQKVLELIGYELDIDVEDIDLDTLQTSQIDLNKASDQLMSEGDNEQLIDEGEIDA